MSRITTSRRRSGSASTASEGPEDLAICMRFMLEVTIEGKTEAVWAAENPREYERISEIAGLVPVTDLHQPTRR